MKKTLPKEHISRVKEAVLYFLSIPIMTTAFVIISLLFSNSCIAENNIADILNKYKDNGFIDTTYYDITTLNPVFAQDTISVSVIEKIFDGLVSVDEKGLTTKGRLAESWKIYEDVYLIPNPNKILRNGKHSNATNIGNYLKVIIQNNNKLTKLKQDQSISNIKKIDIINEEKISLKIDGYYTNLTTQELKGSIKIKYPQRVKITLKTVDEFFEDTIT